MSEQLIPELIPATIDDYPAIKNLTQLYIYDSSRECGFNLNAQGLYEYRDYEDYFEDQSRKAYLVKIEDELAGFVLLNKVCVYPDSDWNMGEFFILAKFQRKGIGQEVVVQICDMHPGKWEVPVIPENKHALHFWRSVISIRTGAGYQEELKTIQRNQGQVERIIFSFDSHVKSAPEEPIRIFKANENNTYHMVELSREKRLNYEKAQPTFWKHADTAGDKSQQLWFDALIKREDHIVLIAKRNENMRPAGFIIGHLTKAQMFMIQGGYR